MPIRLRHLIIQGPDTQKGLRCLSGSGEKIHKLALGVSVLYAVKGERHLMMTFTFPNRLSRVGLK